MAFSFSFAGDDIEEDHQQAPAPPPPAGDTVTGPPPSAAGAFPVQGKPLLPPTEHGLEDLLSRLPSKIAFSLLTVDLGDGQTLQLPRRELWDVRVQLMAEDNADNHSESEAGLGEHDVKTGIYEGGFKSWESSVDLVKVLASERAADVLAKDPCVLIEVPPCFIFFDPLAPSLGIEVLVFADPSCSLAVARRCRLSLSSNGPCWRGSLPISSPWCSLSRITTLPSSIL